MDWKHVKVAPPAGAVEWLNASRIEDGNAGNTSTKSGLSVVFQGVFGGGSDFGC